jgi:pyruvate/2-oxoglutarate dehydrogenase complex dihydrolipoamide acyltransferase (E2) component
MKAERTANAEPETETMSEEASASDGETLLSLVLAEHRAPEVREPARIEGIVVARVAAIGPGGEPRIDLPWSREPAAAKSMIPVGEADVGVEIAVLFESGDPRRPVIMGRMHVPTPVAASEAPVESAPEPEVTTDGERLVFSAEKEIVLRCGESSITLTRAGKILIRGAYVLTRSSGVNRIQGGSVQIN